MSGSISSLNRSATSFSDSNTQHPGRDIILVGYMSIMCLFCVSGNVLVIVTIAVTRKRHRVTSAFLANLAVADLCLGLTLMPFTAYTVYDVKLKMGSIMCQIITFLTIMFATVSNCTITVIALDRYLSIIHCLKYTSWSQRTYGSLAIVFVWIGSILMSIPGILEKYSGNPRTRCFGSLSRSMHQTVLLSVILLIIPMCVLFFSHFTIIRVARMHARKIDDVSAQMNRNIPTNGVIALAFVDPIQNLSMLGLPAVYSRRHRQNIDLDFYSHGTAANTKLNHDSRTRREFLAIIRLIVLVIVFCCIWGPVVVVEFVLDNLRNSQESTKDDVLWRVNVCLIALHCTFNPIMYALSSKQFRSFVIYMFRCNDANPIVIQNLDNSTKLHTAVQNRKRTQNSNLQRIPEQLDAIFTVSKHSYTNRVSDVSTHSLPDLSFKRSQRNTVQFNKTGLSEKANSISLSLSSVDEGVFLDDETVKIRIHPQPERDNTVD